MCRRGGEVVVGTDCVWLGEPEPGRYDSNDEGGWTWPVTLRLSDPLQAAEGAKPSVDE